LLLVLYGCEIWSLISREEHRLRVFQKGVLRRIFEPKMEELKEGLRKTTHNEERHDSYFSPNVVMVIIARKIR
jgi:hypothetical protein